MLTREIVESVCLDKNKRKTTWNIFTISSSAL